MLPTWSSVPVELRVVGEIAAGARTESRRSEPVKPIRIMTGAPMPAGADAVAMVEDSEQVGDGPGPARPIARERGLDPPSGR